MPISLEYLPLEFAEIPVEKTFTFPGGTYLFEFHYNDTYDFFRVKIKDEDDNVLYIAKLVYGGSVYHAVVDGLELEQTIVPFNIQDLLSAGAIDTDDVNSTTLGTVRLYVFG